MDAVQDYWGALEAADRSRAQQTVSALLDAGWDGHRVLDELVVPSQERVGELWLRGEWVVAQEHLVTGVNEAIVHWLISLLPPPSPDADVAVVSCLRGDLHALPALVIAHGLTARGFRVVYVGADPEQSGLLVLVLRLRPRVVLFSASLTSSLSAQKTLFHNIASVGIPLIVGGRAFGGQRARRPACPRARRDGVRRDGGRGRWSSSPRCRPGPNRRRRRPAARATRTRCGSTATGPRSRLT